MSYESRRYSGQCRRCNNKAYRKKLCLVHYKEEASQKLHCTLHKCVRPIFADTLCRTHFKKFNTVCRISDCKQHPVANNMCNFHYRKFNLPALSCISCTRKQFLDDYCFVHFLEGLPSLRKCLKCDRMQVAKGLCKKHYVSSRRASKVYKLVPTTSPNTDEITSVVPVNINQIPDNHRSRSHV